LATVTQETTKTESYESAYRTTKTDDMGFTFKWVTTLVETKNSKGEATEIPSVSRVSTYTTQTIEDNKTRPGTRTITATAGNPIQLKTYTAVDGDVLVVANTIYELNGKTLAAMVDTPGSRRPVTEFPFTNNRFTLSYVDAYAEALTFQVNVNDFTQTTTQTTTIQTGISTTRSKIVFETWKQWYQDFKYTTSCAPEKNIERTVAVSLPFTNQKTITEETIGNGIQTTSQTFQGFSTQTTLNSFFSVFSRTSAGNVGQSTQRQRTYTFTNTFSTQTTTFSIVGDLTITSTIESPGFVENIAFPWRTFGDEAKRLFGIKNSSTSLSQSTTIIVVPQIIREDNFVSETQSQGATTYLSYEEKKGGQFFRKATNLTLFPINGSIAKAAQLEGLASPQLTYNTQNTRSTVGIFMTANAQHTWEGYNNQASISQNVIGAVPFYPTFTGIISRDSEGWELCDTSEFTTVNGSRIGAQFTTTIAWQTVEGTSTKNSTSSGSFTVNSSIAQEFGVTTRAPTIAGGFETPNAARTVIVSPGVVLSTTYDASGSGTASSSFSTGTTYISAPTGPQTITISSLIPRVQGYGVYTQRLLDDGMP
jgi:hypothetical protein